MKGYLDSQVAAPKSIEVRYWFQGEKPEFNGQAVHPRAFLWKPDHRSDWEMSFYQSLAEVDGVLLIRGGPSTLIAGLVAMGHGLAIFALAQFGGSAQKIWSTLIPGRDLPTADEIALMAMPDWDDERAAQCLKALPSQVERKAERVRLARLEARRQEISVRWRAAVAAVMFFLAVLCVFLSWAVQLDSFWAMALLFFAPLIAGVSGATSRLVFDLRQGAAPLSAESAITTAALGLVAGGAAALLFIVAQATTSPAPTVAVGEVAQILSPDQARKLSAFGVLIGFTAGLTLDAVFRKLIASDALGGGLPGGTKGA